MRYFVNDPCIGCGMCASTCPAVFRINDEGTAEANEKDVETAFETEAKEAMNGCPVSAIEEL